MLTFNLYNLCKYRLLIKGNYEVKNGIIFYNTKINIIQINIYIYIIYTKNI